MQGTGVKAMFIKTSFDFLNKSKLDFENIKAINISKLTVTKLPVTSDLDKSEFLLIYLFHAVNKMNFKVNSLLL